ncbi:hypothetical protein BHM03_00031395 [Ensete ventricosum]|nr:hypothetical protein BHM03_00031395 [Ensete ventricosum]
MAYSGLISTKNKVSSYRGSTSSFREQASHQADVPSVRAPYKLCQAFNLGTVPSSPVEVSFSLLIALCKVYKKLYLDIQIRYHCPEEEIALGPSCWLWDYLRRSGASGFLLPLSGGADSSSVAAIVGCMCQLVIKDIEDGDDQVKADSLRIGQYKNGEFPTDSREFAKRIFYTVYMGTENSSEATRSRAKRLADEIGAWHLNVDIDSVVSALLSLFQTLTGKRLRYKYDCSSADINPIGSVSKQDLRSFLRWAAIHLHYPSLAEIEAAPPTAELEPIRSDYNQVFLLTRSCFTCYTFNYEVAPYLLSGVVSISFT